MVVAVPALLGGMAGSGPLVRPAPGMSCAQTGWGHCPGAARNGQERVGWSGAQLGPDLGQNLSVHPFFTGWAHERPMGSSQGDRLLCQLSQLDQDAGGLRQGWEGVGKPPARSEPRTAHLSTDPLEDTVAGRPRAALLERHLLGGEQQSPSTGCGPFFYIGGTNGASM